MEGEEDRVEVGRRRGAGGGLRMPATAYRLLGGGDLSTKRGLGAGGEGRQNRFEAG